MVENGLATPSAGMEDRPPFHHPEHSLDEDHRLLTQVGETAKAIADTVPAMRMVKHMAVASSYRLEDALACGCEHPLQAKQSFVVGGSAAEYPLICAADAAEAPTMPKRGSLLCVSRSDKCF